jgi:hypothetical protein
MAAPVLAYPYASEITVFFVYGRQDCIKNRVKRC